MANVFISVLVDMAQAVHARVFIPLYFMTKYYNHGQKFYDTILFVGLFSIHTCPAPPPPNKQRWTSVSRIFSEYTTALSQGLLSRIVGSTLVCEKRRGSQR